jgi:WD40 repeat protein
MGNKLPHNTIYEWDVFISHASEDKKEFARPLAEALRSHGLRVWFDEFTLKVGDSLRRSIDKGLAQSKFGVVIISSHFLSKEWPQKELDGLVAKEIDGLNVILPVWLDIDEKQLRKYSPTLADRIGVPASLGLEHVVANLIKGMDLKEESTIGHSAIPEEIYQVGSAESRIQQQLPSLIVSLGKSKNIQHYVELKGRGPKHTAVASIQDYVTDWLEDEGQQKLLILGDYGTGKTTFLQKLALDQATTFLKDPVKKRIPLLIFLKDYELNKSIEILARSSFFWLSVTHEDFVDLSTRGKLLLLLDGYDEMRFHSQQGVADSFTAELSSLILRGNKTIITSRTHYFKRASDEQVPTLSDPLFTGFSLDAESDSLKSDSLESDSLIVYIEEFGRAQITTYFQSFFRDRWEEHFATLRRVYGLKDLAKRPILLNLICQTLPEIKNRTRGLDLGALYNTYINLWLDRESWRYLPKKEVILLLSGLALQEFHHGGRIEDFITEQIENDPHLNSKQKRELETNIRTATFLNRDSDGRYSFMHRSFMEFFVAKLLEREILSGEPKTFGSERFPMEIYTFLRDLLKGTNSDKYLFRFIEESKYKYRLGGNSLTLLNQLGVSLSERNLSYKDLSDAIVTEADLSETNFSGSLLNSTKFHRVRLRNTNFAGCRLHGTEFKESGEFQALCWGQENQYLACGCEDGSVRLWDRNFSPELKILKGHHNAVTCMVLCAGGTLLASGGKDNTIILWDTESWTPITQLQDHWSSITSMVWDSRKHQLITGDAEGDILVWRGKRKMRLARRLSTGKKINKLGFLSSPEECFVVSSDVGVELFHSMTFEPVLQVCNYETACNVDKIANEILYLRKSQKRQYERSWVKFITDYHHKELVRFNLANGGSDVLAKWTNSEFREEDDYKYYGNTLYNVRMISAHNDTKRVALIMESDDENYDGYEDRTSRDISREVIIIYQNLVKKLQSGFALSVSFSEDGRYLAVGGNDQIGIYDADNESREFGNLVNSFKQKIDCSGMNLEGTWGLTVAQMQSLKEGGAMGKPEGFP